MDVATMAEALRLLRVGLAGEAWLLLVGLVAIPAIVTGSPRPRRDRRHEERGVPPSGETAARPAIAAAPAVATTLAIAAALEPAWVR